MRQPGKFVFPVAGEVQCGPRTKPPAAWLPLGNPARTMRQEQMAG